VDRVAAKRRKRRRRAREARRPPRNARSSATDGRLSLASNLCDTRDVHVVVETPRHAQAKFKYEPMLGVFVLSRALPLGLSYPYDWGFVPSPRRLTAIRSMYSFCTTSRQVRASCFVVGQSGSSMCHKRRPAGPSGMTG
jgi:hypothetical protein